MSRRTTLVFMHLTTHTHSTFGRNQMQRRVSDGKRHTTPYLLLVGENVLLRRQSGVHTRVQGAFQCAIGLETAKGKRAHDGLLFRNRLGLGGVGSHKRIVITSRRLGGNNRPGFVKAVGSNQ